MSFLTSIFGVSDTQKTMDDTDAKLAALNAKQLAEGKITQNQYNQMNNNIEKGRINVEKEISDAYWDSIDQNPLNPKNLLNSAITGGSKFALATIPWYVWVAGGLFIAHKFFGFNVFKLFKKA